MSIRYRASAWLAATAFIAGCASEPAHDAALHTVQIGERSDTLVVMLPGIRDQAEQFFAAGFVGTAANDAFDVLVVEPELRDYVRGTLVERLRAQVVAPARARGYDEIWLLGVSIGGYGSLLYAAEFPADVRGVVLLAPYLGGRRLTREIAAAGGLDAWAAAPSANPFTAGWAAAQTVTRCTDTTVLLGFGGTDRLAETYEPLLEELPSSQVYTGEGGHEWTTWTPLWDAIKQRIAAL
jgi:pimeloyl-ACP methyl ester carboxylesterase